jgi:hypothetical protein
MNYTIWYFVWGDAENVFTVDILNAPSEKAAISMFRVFNPDMGIYHVAVSEKIDAPIQYREIAPVQN